MTPDLTERESDVLRLRDEGLSLAAVAERLGTTKGSVSSSERAAKLKMATPDLLKTNGQTAEDMDNPYAIVEQAALQCGISRPAARQIIKRLQAYETPPDGALRKMEEKRLIEVLEDRILHTLEYLDGVALGRASAQQLATTVGILIDKRNLLKGEPTQIITIREIQKLDEAAKLLHAEMERRGMLIDVTPQTEELVPQEAAADATPAPEPPALRPAPPLAPSSQGNRSGFRRFS